jgi:hypothetical protein
MVAPRRLLPFTLGVLVAATLLSPDAASAHGIVGRAGLPIPVWLFSWAATIVLVFSFVALSTLWRRPQLQKQRRTRVFRVPAVLARLASLLGVGVFGLVLYSGFAGTEVSFANFSVTFIYVIFWVGLPVASVLFGDVFAVMNPWLSCARAIRWTTRRISRRGSARVPLRYPERLGMWPAVACLVGFAWLELVYVDRDQPSTLAALSLAYFVVMLAGMAAFGIEVWEERADGFGVYFRLLSRMSAVCSDEQGVVYRRLPLSGLPGMPLYRGTVALICTVIGTTTFDGFSNGGLWRTSEPHLESFFESLSLSQTPSQELAYSVGLIACVALVAGIYRLGIAGVRSVSARHETPYLTHAFAHTLVPIGFAYVVAHYFSLLIWQGQAIIYLASDPLGSGANVFGTSTYQINYTFLSFAAIWYVQVAALVAGHVAGLALAHDRALAIYRHPREAIRSQYWMLTVMVGFTSFGLWLLSSVGT